jgi:hypothetical protein
MFYFFCTYPPQVRGDTLRGARHAGRMDTSPKLQKAGRAFLLRLVAENGPERAAQILRDLADEIEGLAEEQIKAGRAPGRGGLP